MNTKKIALLCSTFALVSCTSNKTNTAIITPIAEKPTVVLLEEMSQNLYREFRNKVSNEIYFPFDKFSISQSEKNKLIEQAKWILCHPDAIAIIEGGADNIGKPKYNESLALKRANAVKQFFVSQGIQENRLSCISSIKVDKDSKRSEKERSLDRKVTTVISARFLTPDTDIKTGEVNRNLVK